MLDAGRGPPARLPALFGGVPAPEPVPAPGPAQLPVLGGIFALWSLSLAFALHLLRGLAYFCSLAPPPGWREAVGVLLALVLGTAGPALVHLRIAPTTPSGRFGTTLLATSITSFAVLAGAPIEASFGYDQRVTIAGVGMAFVALPAALVAWILLEVVLWVRARRKR